MMPSVELYPAALTAGRTSKERIMVMTRDLVLYVGPLGLDTTSVRRLGSLTAYVSLGAPLEFRLTGDHWRKDDCFVVPPYVPHQIVTPDRCQATLLIEPETVAWQELPLLGSEDVAAAARARLASRVRNAYAEFKRLQDDAVLHRDLSELLFDSPLPKRTLDRRIQAIIDRMKQDPCGEFSASRCASDYGLSVCRFTHLFKDETGTTFRRFRAWKRARKVLEHLRHNATLTCIALDSGYPDLTHFSHTMRQIHGMTPTAMHQGARRLAYFGSAAEASEPLGLSWPNTAYRQRRA